MKKYLLLLSLLMPLTAMAWSSSDKKTADESIYLDVPGMEEQVKAYIWYPDNYGIDEQLNAVVMAHGCGGAHYKDNAYQWTKSYISGKYRVWAKLFNQQNMVVMLVDSFTTRDDDGDVGGGVCGSSDSLARPDKIDPISVRPADIAAGIHYFKTNEEVAINNVGVLGFSNGGTSVLALANHQSVVEHADQLADSGKQIFDVPFQDSYKADAIVALYPGCGMNGYSDATQGIFSNQFASYTDTFIFAASNDTSLPDDTPEKCQALMVLDTQRDYVGANMMLKVVGETKHQFDYKEDDEPAVQKAIQRIIGLFSSM
jgi:carboxymethylenebutenolidase